MKLSNQWRRGFIKGREKKCNSKRVRKLVDECLVISDGEDSPKVALAKKVGEETMQMEVENQLYRLDQLGPTSKEQQRNIADRLVSGPKRVIDSAKETYIKGYNHFDKARDEARRARAEKQAGAEVDKDSESEVAAVPMQGME